MSDPDTIHKHSCPECRCAYSSERRLSAHIRRKHEKRSKLGEEHSCCYCEQSFENELKLTFHLKKSHGKERRRMDKGNCYIKKYRKVKREIPDKYHDAYDKLTGSGKSLLGIQAAVCYIESSVDQETAGEAFAVSKMTVRKTVEALIDEGAVSLEYVQENCKRTGKGQFGERTAGPRNWQPEQ